MVESSLYCLMDWFDSPGEVEILLLGSVPHHQDTLSVPPEACEALLTATADVIEQTIPDDNAGERAVWNELRADLAALTRENSAYSPSPKHKGPLSL